MRFPLLLLRSALVLAALGRSAPAGPPDPMEPPPPKAAESGALGEPIPIFLRTPADRDEFWKMLARPDLVILDGEMYRKLRQASEASRPLSVPSPAVVQSVVVGGEVEGEWARLVVDLRVALDQEGPAWVPIHLDGLTLSEIREGDRDLPARVAEDKSWSVELAGRREHPVRIVVMAPIRTSPLGRRLELSIPPAASTRLGLDAGSRVLSAATGKDEPVSVVAAEDRPGVVRMSGRIGPRSRLELTWREPPAPELRLSPLLSCQGEIAVEVEPGSIRSRSSWLISAIRGSADSLSVRIDPAEEVVEIQVDGRPIPVETRREAGRLVVSIPLAEPIAGSRTATLSLICRRAIATPGPARVALQGYSFDLAKVQAGVLAISRTGPLFLNPTPGRALRRIDPRTDLPEGLRARQDTALAFEFNDQPFELQLGIDPAPPGLQIGARTSIAIEPRSARVDTFLDCRVVQGRPFEVRVTIPKDLEFEEAGPPELVATAQLLLDETTTGVEAEEDRPRVLLLSLNKAARESGSFTLRLRGRRKFDRPGLVDVPLFRPPTESASGGRIEVLGDRNVSVELDESGEEPPPFRPDFETAPVRGSGVSTKRGGPDSSLLSLRYDSDPRSIPLRLAILPRTLRHETTMTASVEKKAAEVVQDVVVDVSHGVVTWLELLIPPEVPEEWELDGVDRSTRELLGRDADGSRRVRIPMDRGEAGSFRLRFRYRALLSDPPSPGQSSRVKLAPIKIVEGISASCLARIVAGGGVEPRAEGKGWTIIDAPPPPENGPPNRLMLSRSLGDAGPIDIEVRPVETVALPGLVASRLWLRSSQRADDEVATSALYWLESRGRSITLALPAGSRWIMARVGGADIGPGDLIPSGADEYRIQVPGTIPAGPVLLGVEYLTPSAASSRGWPAPELLDGVVQQTVWQFRTLGTRAGVGVPRDWTDENEWYWDGFLWLRRPGRTPSELSLWLTGGNSLGRLPEPLDASEGHAYLFSRPGPPSSLPFPVYSRLSLLLFCSGPVLVAGLMILARRPSPRLSAATALVVAFASGTLLDVNATILVAQSSALGFALLVAAVGMNWLLDRRGRGAPAREPIPVESARMTISTTGQVAMAGSDDSTAIRPRPPHPVASTADHILLTRPAGKTEEGPLTADFHLR